MADTTEKVQQATETTPTPTSTSTSSSSSSSSSSDINPLKRSHPEYYDKTKEELVAEEKKKLQKMQSLVNEVQEGTKEIDAKIAEAKGSSNVAERNVLITDIKNAAA